MLQWRNPLSFTITRVCGQLACCDLTWATYEAIEVDPPATPTEENGSSVDDEEGSDGDSQEGEMDMALIGGGVIGLIVIIGGGAMFIKGKQDTAKV